MERFRGEDVGLLAGRILLGHIFLVSGVRKIFGWSATAGYMASKGMAGIWFFLPMAVILELAGALSLVTGFRSRWGALLLVVFLVPTTFIFHDFWNLVGEERGRQTINFMKNLAILGGLVLAACSDPGGLSLGRRPSDGK